MRVICCQVLTYFDAIYIIWYKDRDKLGYDCVIPEAAMAQREESLSFFHNGG